jgi:L-lysine exporter family protein LysE/ArgO
MKVLSAALSHGDHTKVLTLRHTNMNTLLCLLKGFSASSGLIIAIGAQNAFVIRQGLKRQHLFLTALICSLIDAILIVCGVIGFGFYISEYPVFIELTKYFAAIFLFFYGLVSLRSVFKKKTNLNSMEEPSVVSAKKIVVSLLALSLLNPHVYLDTVILLGSIASQQPAHEQIYFAVGAMSASFAWFFAITFGAQLLAPYFQKDMAWRIIDGLTAITMWMIALNVLNLI